MRKACIKKYGKKLSTLYIFINILRYLLSSYLPYLYLGARAILTGAYSVGNFNLLTDTAIGLKKSLESIFNIIPQMQQHSKYIQDYRDFIAYEPMIKENPTGKEAKKGANSLEIKGLYFRYGEKDE